MNGIEIKDLYLAAYLRAAGVSLESFKRVGSHTVFIFQENEKIGELIDKYVTDRAQINVKVFRNSLRDLKSIASGDIPAPKNRKE